MLRILRNRIMISLFNQLFFNFSSIYLDVRVQWYFNQTLEKYAVNLQDSCSVMFSYTHTEKIEKKILVFLKVL